MLSIFKYTQYRREFFDNFYLKLSMFGEFNDPFELVPGNFISTLSEEEANEFYSYPSSFNDPATYLDKFVEVQAGARACVGVICFTSTNDNILMWSHYANNHEGICIEFDLENSFFNGKYKKSCFDVFSGSTVVDHYANIGVISRVKYSTERPTFIDPSEISYDTEFWFIKSNDWAYENEYRLLLPTDHAIREKEMLFYKIDKASIKSVIVGCKMSSNVKREIFDICYPLGIKVKETFVNSAKFKLDIFDYHHQNHNKHINYYNFAKMSKY